MSDRAKWVRRVGKRWEWAVVVACLSLLVPVFAAREYSGWECLGIGFLLGVLSLLLELAAVYPLLEYVARRRFTEREES